MSTVVVFAAGAALGALVGWFAGRRAGRRTDGDRSAAARVEPPKVPGLDLPIEPTLDTLLRLLVDQAFDRMDQPCVIALREQDGGPVRIRVVSEAADTRLINREVDLQSAAWRVVTDGLFIVEDAHRSFLGGASRDRRRAPSGGVGVPIAAGPRVFGVLIAFGDPPQGGTEAVALLQPLANAFGPFLLPAMEAALANHRAETDELTDLPNRRGFDKALRRASSGPVALIAIDIDHFKQVNDSLGHAAGDIALRHLARILRDALREGDVAARIGGEEFAVLLPGGDLRLAMEVAERLRSLVALKPFHAGGEPRNLTISGGVAATPYPVSHPDSLLSAADAALYRAKGAGRNCVIAAAPGATAVTPAP